MMLTHSQQQAAAGSWTPGQLGAKLLGMWDAERADLLTLVGALVTTWPDTVTGCAPTQATSGFKPVYSATSFNGRPGITFDGTDDSLLAGTQPFPSGANPSEIWGLFDQKKAAADTSIRLSLAYGSGASATSRYIGRSVTAGVNRAFCNVGNGAAAVQVTDTHVDLSGKHVVRLIASATTMSQSVDGAAAVTAASVPGTGAAQVRIGATLAGANFGNITANMFLITSLLTNGEAASLLAYLKARGGIA